MKIGIFGSKNTPESQLLEKAAIEKGHEAVRFSQYDFAFELRENIFSIRSEIDFADLDIVIIRGIDRQYNFDNRSFNKANEALITLRYLKEVLDIPLVDEYRVLDPFFYQSGKMMTAQKLAQKNIPQPDAWQFGSKEKLKEAINGFSFPLIAKSPNGRKGLGIYKLDCRADLEKLLSDLTTDSFPYIIQEYLPSDGDIRVFCVGYKALGAMKRFIPTGDFRANISQGGRGEKIVLPKEAIEIAENAAEITKTEIAGVDLIESNGKYYVIEVNQAPQFRGFIEYTGINPANAIVDYLETKVKK